VAGRTRLAVGVRLFYWAVFFCAAAPLVYFGWQVAPVLVPLVAPDLVLGWDAGLGPNPVETMLHTTGRDGLALLLITLAVTPIRRLTGWNRIQVVRRMLGLWAFAYAALHLTIYVVFNHLGDVRAIWDDVVERPFILSGMLTFVILLALAMTSTTGMMRRLGRRWSQLHRLVYLAAFLGIVHFAWGQKADIREPLQWGMALAVLLAIRAFHAIRTRRRRLVSLVPEA
jgi:sulfoxide reductase heme-binding subunit YedZ